MPVSEHTTLKIARPMHTPKDGLHPPGPIGSLDNQQQADAQWSMLTARRGDHLVLMPGQLYFGTKAATVRTLLGSCVAITLWNPHRQLGGMCHYLLPSRGTPGKASPEGRYGDEALALMVQWLRMARTTPGEYEAHLYGGADTQPGVTGKKTGIGLRNIEMGWALIEHHGFQLQAVDVGDNVPRHVRLCLSSGQVDLRRGQAITGKGIA